MTDLDLFGYVSGDYGVILADPPWKFELQSAKGEAKSPQAHYDCMTLEDLRAMPVQSLAAKDCALFMWTTAPFLPASIEILDHWGFKYKTAGAWAKQSATTGGWAFGTGYVFRSAAEFFIVGTRGRPKVRNRSVRNLIVAPRREHSRKPPNLHAMAEALFDGPYIELFAREARPGWQIWGNETGKFSGDNQTLDGNPV